jgi:hypothetical protein
MSWKPILLGGLLVLSGCAASTTPPPATSPARVSNDGVALEVSPIAPTRASSVVVRGNVARGSRVTVAGRRTAVRTGRFHARVALSVGRNHIRIVARKAGSASAHRTLTIRRRPTPRPASTPVPTPTPTPTAASTSTATKTASNCDPNYVGACLDPNAPDYDCLGGSGDVPKYTGPVQVVGNDHYGLDRDGDGDACE